MSGVKYRRKKIAPLSETHLSPSLSDAFIVAWNDSRNSGGKYEPVSIEWEPGSINSENVLRAVLGAMNYAHSAGRYYDKAAEAND